MERITYRISLDTHRNGVQRTLQGIQTGDNISRRIEISLVEGTETYNLPLDGLEAVMYVLTPSGESPSVNACEINAENNKIIYDLLPTDTLEEGTVSMQLKLIETSMTGAERVLISPKFAIEVWESEVSDSEAESTPTFTALEMALAKAKEVYDSRLIGFEIIEEGEDKGRIIVSYADGTTYESDVIKEALGMIADIGIFVTRAETAAEDAESARDEASGYKDLVEAKVDIAESAKVAAELAKTVSEEAMAETVSAKNVVVEAKTEVLSAKEVAVTSAANALASESNAQTSEANARSSKISAQESAESALSSKTSAQTSAESALSSKNSAENYAKTSQSYAVGGTGARPGEDIDNAKYYKELCQQIAGGLEGGFIPMGTVSFETLATLTPNFGYMYNISNEFVTDNRFKDGPGKRYAAGTNVYFTADSMWDCLSGAIPTINGKNGNSITLDGADLLVSGYTKATAVSDITPNDTINQALGKLEKKDEEKASKATTLSGYGITDAYTKAEANTEINKKATKATTLSGYGITDAYTKSEVDTELGKKANSSTTLAGYGITNAYTKDETDSKVKTAAAKTGSGTSVTNTIAKSTTFDSAISTLLNNDHALEENIATINSILSNFDLSNTSLEGQTISLSQFCTMMAEKLYPKALYFFKYGEGLKQNIVMLPSRAYGAISSSTANLDLYYNTSGYSCGFVFGNLNLKQYIGKNKKLVITYKSDTARGSGDWGPFIGLVRSATATLAYPWKRVNLITTTEWQTMEYNLDDFDIDSSDTEYLWFDGNGLLHLYIKDLYII